MYFSLSLNLGVTSGVKQLCYHLGISSVGLVLFGVLIFSLNSFTAVYRRLQSASYAGDLDSVNQVYKSV